MLFERDTVPAVEFTFISWLMVFFSGVLKLSLSTGVGRGEGGMATVTGS